MRSSTKQEKMAYAGGRKDTEWSADNREVNSGEGKGKPLLYS
jgi:hypothetical protein